MARSVKTAKAPLSAHQAGTGVRTGRAGTAPAAPDARTADTADGKPSAWPIYEELVAELGDPTA